MSPSRIRLPQATPEADLQARILRGEDARWPDNAGAAFERRFLDACAAEELAPLVDHLLRSAPGANAWPVALRESLRHEARMQAAHDLLRERELIRVLAAFAARGIGALLLKGAALAYSHYPTPASRTRCDTDVLIRTADRASAKSMLARLGYQRRNDVSGTLVSFEECHVKRDRGVDHVIDLHWQVNNAQVFAHALGYDEAHARSVPLPHLGPHARALCPPHALLLACMHRAAHLGADGEEGHRLVWLYDIHLIAGAMTVDEWREFAGICVARAMRRITLDAFRCTHEALGTVFPADVMQRLGGAIPVEISAAYLTTGRAHLLITDLRALGTWRERATLVREMCLPPLEYVLARYRPRHRWQLPWLYFRRLVGGCWKLVQSRWNASRSTC